MMERLTRIDSSGRIAGARRAKGDFVGYDEMIAQLYAYEDTGLMPAEIIALVSERDAALRRAEAAKKRLSGADDRICNAINAVEAIWNADVPMNYADYNRLYDLISGIVPAEGGPADGSRND